MVPPNEYTGFVAFLYEWQTLTSTLLAAFLAAIIAIVAIFRDHFSDIFQSKEKRARFAADCRFVRRSIVNFIGDLRRLKDRVKNDPNLNIDQGDLFSKSRVAVSSPISVVVIPFAPACEERMRMHFGNFKLKDVELFYDYERSVQLLHDLGERNGKGYILNFASYNHLRPDAEIYDRFIEMTSELLDVSQTLLDTIESYSKA